MKIEIVGGILMTSMTITHKGTTKTLDNMIIDTGSAHTWINLDAVEDDVDVAPEDGDQIVTAFGIGGRDIAIRKRIDRVDFGTFRASDFQVDFGRLDYGISGLIGLDLLMAGDFFLDLARLTLYQTEATTE
ncbi:hypothetical protein SD51_10850 [Alicyclobacillus tengchongensis]|nr:hypothetical protein SD51_10850 [Alicyclobacillus tengchongensis]